MCDKRHTYIYIQFQLTSIQVAPRGAKLLGVVRVRVEEAIFGG